MRGTMRVMTIRKIAFNVASLCVAFMLYRSMILSWKKGRESRRKFCSVREIPIQTFSQKKTRIIALAKLGCL